MLGTPPSSPFVRKIRNLEKSRKSETMKSLSFIFANTYTYLYMFYMLEVWSFLGFCFFYCFAKLFENSLQISWRLNPKYFIMPLLRRKILLYNYNTIITPNKFNTHLLVSISSIFNFSNWFRNVIFVFWPRIQLRIINHIELSFLFGLL